MERLSATGSGDWGALYEGSVEEGGGSCRGLPVRTKAGYFTTVLHASLKRFRGYRPLK